MGDWGRAILVAVLGLSIVFIVLALIMLVLIVMEKIFAPKKKEEVKQSVKQEVKKEVPKKAVEVKKADDTELIAVLTAAVSAYLNATSSSGISSKFKIKSYRRLGDTNSAWNNASRKENIYSRF